MSIKTWKEEFYKVDANDVDDKDALDHSISKWTGLLPENLKKHDVELFTRVSTILVGDNSFDPDNIIIDARSCALCVHHLMPGQKPCMGCPIWKFRSSRCDKSDLNDYDGLSEWEEFSINLDPVPMLSLLTQVKANLK